MDRDRHGFVGGLIFGLVGIGILVISAIAPLNEGPDWFERLYKQEPGLLKVILQP